MRALNSSLLAYIRQHDEIYTKLFYILDEFSILQTTIWFFITAYIVPIVSKHYTHLVLDSS
jgi:hypothetical protein